VRSNAISSVRKSTSDSTGVLKASVEKQRKRIYILEKMKSSNISKKERKLLAKKLKQNIPQKPNVENLNPECW
jgi:hypothetical protein